MNLFMAGMFRLRSGVSSTYKIECDALSSLDWLGIAAMLLADGLPPFTDAIGVPRGGLPLADVLWPHRVPAARPRVMFCEDVWTTGGSTMSVISDYFANRPDIPCPGADFFVACAFARGPYPEWVYPALVRPSAKAAGQGGGR